MADVTATISAQTAIRAASAVEQVRTNKDSTLTYEQKKAQQVAAMEREFRLLGMLSNNP